MKLSTVLVLSLVLVGGVACGKKKSATQPAAKPSVSKVEQKKQDEAKNPMLYFDAIRDFQEIAGLVDNYEVRKANLKEIDENLSRAEKEELLNIDARTIYGKLVLLSNFMSENSIEKCEGERYDEGDIVVEDGQSDPDYHPEFYKTTTELEKISFTLEDVYKLEEKYQAIAFPKPSTKVEVKENDRVFDSIGNDDL